MPTTDLVLNAFYPVCECVVYSTYACIAVFHAITKIFIKAGVTIGTLSLECVKGIS